MYSTIKTDSNGTCLQGRLRNQEFIVCFAWCIDYQSMDGYNVQRGSTDARKDMR